MGLPPNEPYPWMDPWVYIEADDEPEWCERCDRPFERRDGCAACGDEGLADERADY